MPRRPGRPMSLWAQVGLYTSLGFILPAGAVGGLGLGWLLDRSFHTSPFFAIILSLAGAGAGVREVLRILTRAEKRDGTDEPGNGSDAS